MRTPAIPTAIVLALAATHPLAAQQDPPPRAIPARPENTPPQPPPPIPRAVPVQPTAPTNTPPSRTTPPTTPPPPSPPDAPPAQPAESDSDQVIRLTPSEAVEPTSSPEDIQFRVASNLYKKKQFRLAAPEFERYLRYFPGAPNREAAVFRLAECYRELGLDREARDFYRRLITTYRSGPFVGSAAYRMAEMMVRSDDLEAARSYFALAAENLDNQKLRMAATFRQARCLEMLGRPESARAVFRDLLQVTEDNPYREPTLQALAEIARQTGRRAEAIDYYSSLAEDAEKPAVRADAAVNAASLANAEGNTPLARELYTKALQIPIEGAWQGIARLGLLRIHYDNGEYDMVIKRFTESEGRFPENLRAEALLVVGNAYRQTDRLKEASDIYERVIQEFPNSNHAREAAYQQLVALYTIDDPRLLPSIDRFLESSPTGVNADQARLLKAETHYKRGEIAEAAALFQDLASSSLPGQFLPDVFHKLGWCQAQLGRHAEAVATFSAFLDKFPSNPQAPAVLAERGLSRQALGNIEAALADFQRVVDEFPESRQAEVALQQTGLIHGQLNNNAEMVTAFRTLLDRFPDTAAAAQANYWIGWALFEEKAYRECIPAFEQSIALDPDSYRDRAELRVMLAHYYLEEVNETAEHAERLRQSDTATPVPGEVLYWLGARFAERGEHARAEQYLDTLTSRDNPAPFPPDAWLLLAESRRATKNWEGSLNAARTFIKTVDSPERKADGYLAIAATHLESGDSQAARQAVSAAMGLQPEGLRNARARMLEAEIDFAETRYAEAAKAFQRVAVLYDDDQMAPRALERAYVALQRSGNAAQASQILNEIRTRFPEFPLTVTDRPNAD